MCVYMIIIIICLYSTVYIVGIIVVQKQYNNNTFNYPRVNYKHNIEVAINK